MMGLHGDLPGGPVPQESLLPCASSLGLRWIVCLLEPCRLAAEAALSSGSLPCSPLLIPPLSTIRDTGGPWGFSSTPTSVSLSNCVLKATSTFVAHDGCSFSPDHTLMFGLVCLTTYPNPQLEVRERRHLRICPKRVSNLQLTWSAVNTSWYSKV